MAAETITRIALTEQTVLEALSGSPTKTKVAYLFPTSLITGMEIKGLIRYTGHQTITLTDKGAKIAAALAEG